MTTEISYNGNMIASLKAGQTATLNCAGKAMTDNVVITVPVDSDGSYQDGYTKGYTEGETAGYTEGQTDGIEQGKQAEYDRFWDSAQNNGSRGDYAGFFGGNAWTADNMKPKYDVVPASAAYMFAYCGYRGDLDDVFTKRGKKLDFSRCKYVSNLLYMAQITSVGTIDCSASIETSIASLLNAPNMETIRCFTPPPNAALTASNFSSSGALRNITIGGAIYKSINFSRCTNLTAESIQSILDHLADLTGQTAQTLTFPANVGNKLTDAQKATITAKNWTLVY